MKKYVYYMRYSIYNIAGNFIGAGCGEIVLDSPITTLEQVMNAAYDIFFEKLSPRATLIVDFYTLLRIETTEE